MVNSHDSFRFDEQLVIELSEWLSNTYSGQVLRSANIALHENIEGNWQVIKGLDFEAFIAYLGTSLVFSSLTEKDLYDLGVCPLHINEYLARRASAIKIIRDFPHEKYLTIKTFICDGMDVLTAIHCGLLV